MTFSASLGATMSGPIQQDRQLKFACDFRPRRIQSVRRYRVRVAPCAAERTTHRPRRMRLKQSGIGRVFAHVAALAAFLNVVRGPARARPCRREHRNRIRKADFPQPGLRGKEAPRARERVSAAKTGKTCPAALGRLGVCSPAGRIAAACATFGQLCFSERGKVNELYARRPKAINISTTQNKRSQATPMHNHRKTESR